MVEQDSYRYKVTYRSVSSELAESWFGLKSNDNSPVTWTVDGGIGDSYGVTFTPSEKSLAFSGEFRPYPIGAFSILGDVSKDREGIPFWIHMLANLRRQVPGGAPGWACFKLIAWFRDLYETAAFHKRIGESIGPIYCGVPVLVHEILPGLTAEYRSNGQMSLDLNISVAQLEERIVRPHEPPIGAEPPPSIIH